MSARPPSRAVGRVRDVCLLSRLLTTDFQPVGWQSSLIGFKAAMPAVAKLVWRAFMCNAAGRARPGCREWCLNAGLCPAGAAAAAAEGEQFLQSSILVAGTTTVWAYPGQELKLQNLLGSMPGAQYPAPQTPHPYSPSLSPGPVPSVPKYVRTERKRSRSQDHAQCVVQHQIRCRS